MSERVTNKPSAKQKLTSTGIAAGVLLASVGCANQPRGGTVSNEQIVTVSDTNNTDRGFSANQHFGVTGAYELDGVSKSFTSHVIVYCEEALSLSPRTDEQKLVIGARAVTLLGEKQRDDIIVNETVTVGMFDTCANYFPTVDHEKKALDYVAYSLDNPNRTDFGDGYIVDNPRDASASLLQDAEQGICPPVICGN